MKKNNAPPDNPPPNNPSFGSTEWFSRIQYGNLARAIYVQKYYFIYLMYTGADQVVYVKELRKPHPNQPAFMTMKEKSIEDFQIIIKENNYKLKSYQTSTGVVEHLILDQNLPMGEQVPDFLFHQAKDPDKLAAFVWDGKEESIRQLNLHHIFIDSNSLRSE